ncbi:MAG: hypothetical protein WCI27_08790 [Candidatus Omnitrophota bacterium]
MAVEPHQINPMKAGYLLPALMGLFLAGCAGSAVRLDSRGDTLPAQIEAAKKVTAAMAPAGVPAEKYSPVTGRHYSGALEFEPGTGVKLVPVEE